VESFTFLIKKNQPSAVIPYTTAPNSKVNQPEKPFCNEACLIKTSAKTVITLNNIPKINAIKIGSITQKNFLNLITFLKPKIIIKKQKNNHHSV
jgi:hypothetical protein